MTQRAAAIPSLAEAFRQHGFEGASVARLCAATGLGKGSLYNFFPGGKQEMAAAVLGDVSAWFTGSVFEPLREAEPGGPTAVSAAISDMFDAVIAYFRSGQRICLQGALALGKERDSFAETIAGYFGQWIDSLALALRAAGASEPAARAAAAEVIAAIQGAIVLTRALDDRDIFLAVVEQGRARLGGFTDRTRDFSC